MAHVEHVCANEVGDCRLRAVSMDGARGSLSVQQSRGDSVDCLLFGAWWLVVVHAV